MSLRKKNGYPLREDFDNPIFLQNFSLLSSAFNQNYSKNITERKLANIVFTLLYFMEDRYGKASSDRTFVKLPLRLFRDYSLEGSLHHILSTTLTFQEENSVDLSEQSASETIDSSLLEKLLRALEVSLLKNKYFQYPVVYFSTALTKSVVKELTGIVTAYRGSVTTDETAATHIIEYDPEVDILPEQLTEEFIRPLEIHGSTALIHWWYYPDSYDESIPAIDVDLSELPESTLLHVNKPTWRVCCRFIRDTAQFNEWGNEYDYEIEATLEQPENTDTPAVKPEGRKTKAGKRKYDDKRKKETQKSASRQVQATEKLLQEAPLPSIGSGAKKSNTMNITNGNESTYSAATAESKTEEEGSDVNRKRSCSADVSANKRKRTTISADDWLQMDFVSSLEMKYIGDVITQMSTAEYITMRNFIVSQYHQQPSVYLSATDCRKRMSGDAAAIVMIHHFLDAFGAINMNIKPAVRPAKALHLLTAPQVVVSAVASSGARHWTSRMNQSLLKHVGDALQKGIEVNWESVACAIGENITADAAQKQFMRISLSSSVQKEENDVEFATVMQGDVLQSVIDAALAAANRSNVSDEDAMDVVKTAVSTVGRAAQHTAAAEKLESEAQDMLNDYIQLKSNLLDEKIKLLEAIQHALELEKFRIDADKRDLQIQRTQFAYQQAHSMS